LNALITLSPSVENDVLTLQPIYIQAGNFIAPLWFLKALQSFSWGNQLNENPDFREWMGHVRSLKMESDRIVLERK
jgi:hypothetical protein